jgi:hypothetical protein
MRKWIKRMSTVLLISAIAVSGAGLASAKTVAKKPPPLCKHSPAACRR